ncbi:hypothetical protein ACJX0J_014452, partial [Zea mays]
QESNKRSTRITPTESANKYFHFLQASKMLTCNFTAQSITFLMQIPPYLYPEIYNLLKYPLINHMDCLSLFKRGRLLADLEEDEQPKKKLIAIIEVILHISDLFQNK